MPGARDTDPLDDRVDGRDESPEERAEMELKWQAQRTGISRHGIEQRAKELAATKEEPPFGA